MLVSDPRLIIDESDLHVRRLIHHLLSLSSQLQEIHAQIASMFDLTETQYMMLRSIRHLERDKPPSISDLATYLRLSTSFVTNQVTQLVALGLLDKKSDAGDKRRLMLNTTARCEALIVKNAAEIARINDTIFAAMPTDVLTILVPLLGQISKDADRAAALAGSMVPRKGKTALK